jgi:hypothetical protein
MPDPVNPISPKVKIPSWVLAVIGVILVVIGYLINDHTVVAAGFSAIGSSGILAVIGIRVPDPLRAEGLRARRVAGTAGRR